MTNRHSTGTAAEPRRRSRPAITFDKVNRRAHLYAGLFFLPWFFVYGVSSIYFSHPSWFQQGAQWVTVSERAYKMDMPPDAGLESFRDSMQKASGVDGRFTAFRTPAGLIRMYKPGIIAATQVTYYPEKERLRVERSSVTLRGVLTRVHTRGGFGRSLLEDLWAVIVDLVQIGIIVWIASGIYMWWRQRHLRRWGLLALGSGAASFAYFMLAL